MAKILITGSTGFIGRYVIQYLKNTEHSIIATGSRENITQCSWLNGITYIPFDLCRKQDNLFKFFNSPDHLIHLAWSNLSSYNDDAHTEVHFPNHYRFLKNFIINGLNSLTVAGSCLEYGKQEGQLKETLLVNPTTKYGVAKNNLRQSLEKLQEEVPYSLKWLRLFYMYGKGQSKKSLIPLLNKALCEKRTSFNMSKGDQVRDYLHVSDVAKIISIAAIQDTVLGIINCCSGNPVTLKNFILSYLKDINKSITLNTDVYPYPEYEPMKFWGDCEKLNQILK